MKTLNIRTNVLTKLFSAMAMAVSVTCAFGDTWTDDDDHVWTYTAGESSATVTGVTPCEYDLVIPDTLGGKPVASFSATMFKGNTKIASIEFPDTITEIGDNAFNGCTQLQIVKFGSGLTKIGEWSFSGCSLLQKVELPIATTTIGRGAFNNCVKLTTAKLPGVTEIPGAESEQNPNRSYFHGYGAFYGCEKLKTLEFGNSLTFIGHGAFYGCKELYDVLIPDSVKAVGNYSFAECSKLYSVSFGRNVEQIGCYAFNNDVHLAVVKFGGTLLHTFESGAFNGCEDLNNVILPEGLKKINSYIFQGCSALESIVIPDTVTNMAIGVFANCTALRVAKLGSGLTAISGADDEQNPNRSYFHGYGVFYKCTALTNVLISANIKTIHCGAFYGCSELPEVTIPNKVTEIKGYAFAECVNLKKAVIGDSVRYVGNHAFYNDIRLETLVLGKKVQTIDNNAFDTCTALKSFKIPDTVLTIGNWAFSNCDSLTKVELPDSVGVIGTGSFAYCDKLTDVFIGASLEEITGAESDQNPNRSYFHGYGAFYNCVSLTNVCIGSSVATIGCGAFYGCTSLVEIDIPSSVSAIKGYAFGNCPALKIVTMANGGVRSIGEHAFAENANLETVTLGDRLQTIGESAFQKCPKLKNLIFPDTLQTMNGWCFAECSSLTKVVIPNEVVLFDSGVFANCTALESVCIGSSVIDVEGADSGQNPNRSYFHGYGAFYGCTALKSVDLGQVSTISCGAFYGCSALESINIPNTVITIEPYAFANCTALRSATVGTRLTTMGGHVFDGDGALHYVEFKGAAAPTSVGENVFNGTKDRMTTYVANGSTGWVALYQGGLPETWQGRAIAYGPAPATAANPYDFYPYTITGIKIDRKYYDWPAPLMLRNCRYYHSEYQPYSHDTFKQGETIFLNYAFNEYWRGSMFEAMTNTFVLTGAKTAQENIVRKSTRLDYSYCWGTNITLNILKDLGPGEYTLTMNLNAGKNLAESDYSNNSTSVTFKVTGRESYTIGFNGNGVEMDEISRQVWEGEAIGALPTVTTPNGWKFLGWFTAATGGEAIASTTKPTANATYYAQWTKANLKFHTGYWTTPVALFARDSASASPVTTFTEGDTIYLNYGFENGCSAVIKDCVNKFTLSTGYNYADDWTDDELEAGKWGWLGDANLKTALLQDLTPGTYTLTCTLDATGVIDESDETDNTYVLTFTVKARDAETVKVTVDGTELDLTPGAKYGTALKDPTPVSGKTFVGWYTGPNGTGTKVTADSIVPTTAITLYAYWTTNSTPTPEKEDEETTDTTVKITINGSTVDLTPGAKYGTALADPTPVSGKTFVGWYTGPNGTGTKVTADSIVPSTAITLYAYWKDVEEESNPEEETSYWLFDDDDLTGYTAAGQTYDGVVQDDSGKPVGTITLKAAKMSKNKSKITVSVVLGTKKYAYKGEWDYSTDSGTIGASKKGLPDIQLVVYSNGMYGKIGDYTFQGARNVFTSKESADKSTAKAVLSALQGTYAMTFTDTNGRNALSVSIASKGKVKVSGTLANGKKVSVTSQLIVGNGICCVPVVQIKSGVNVAMTLWLSTDGKSYNVVGINGAKFGKSGTLASGATFTLETAALAKALGDDTFVDYLPNGIVISQNKTKWIVAPDEKGKAAKAGKVALAKDGTVDEAKAGANPSGLKLAYTAKSGTFKGSFKAYYLDAKGKVKSASFTVTGVMIDGVGYGTATAKKIGSFAVTIQ